MADDILPSIANILNGGTQQPSDDSILPSIAAIGQSAKPASSPAAPQASTIMGRPVGLDYLGAATAPGTLPPLAQPKTGMPSDLPQVAYGAEAPWIGATQLLAHGIASIAPNDYTLGRQQTIDSAIQRMRSNADQQAQEVPGSGAARLAGGLLSTAPIAAVMPGATAASLTGRVAAGTGAGALTSAMQPVENPQQGFAQQKAEQAGIGALTGALPPIIGGGIARIVSPQMTPEVKALVDRGVQLTPGQRLGGIANSIEQKLTSVPVLGETIAGARARAVQQFNRATINEVLSPIGQSLDKDTPIGHEAIAEMSSKIGDAYDNLLPKLNARAPDLTALQQNAQVGLLPDRAQQFDTILQQKLYSKVSPGGGMTGEGWKEAESELGRLAQGYHSSADMDQRQLGDALQEAQAQMRARLAQDNPQYAPQLQAINSAWAMSKRVENAAARVGGEPGTFSAPQLVNATKALDRSRGKSAFARGNAMMQDFAENARKVLANTVPDSGTAGRGELIGVPGALYGLYEGGFPHLATGASAGLLGGMAAYSRPGVSLFNLLANQRPASAPAVAGGIRAALPYLSRAGGLLAGAAQ